MVAFPGLARHHRRRAGAGRGGAVPGAAARTAERFTLPVGVQTFFQQNGTDGGSVMALAVVMMLPPVLVFTALNRYFSVGGIGGSLAGT